MTLFDISGLFNPFYSKVCAGLHMASGCGNSFPPCCLWSYPLVSYRIDIPLAACIKKLNFTRPGKVQQMDAGSINHTHGETNLCTKTVTSEETNLNCLTPPHINLKFGMYICTEAGLWTLTLWCWEGNLASMKRGRRRVFQWPIDCTFGHVNVVSV